MKRTIDTVFEGAPKHWVGDGFHVSNYFPSATETQKRMSPFFLLDYQMPERYSPTARRRGVGSHPHRGIETVTTAFAGSIAHRDSTGSGGVIHPGEVQWMTAGGGILHNEYHDSSFAKKGGVLHMVQIWVNLPRKDKMTPPKYQPLTGGNIAEVALPKGNGKVRVIAGAYEGTAGPAETFSPVQMLDLRLSAGDEVRLTAPRDHNAALLVLDGKLSANGSPQAAAGQCVLFKNDGDEVYVSAKSDSIGMFLSGAPLEEPLVHYGPFVMNSVDEINQAVEDFNNGKFGELAD